jgi:hypothetical protein
MSNISKEGVMKKDDPKYIDLLDEDLPLAGQKFACLSFVSPEKLLIQKEQYFFNQFLNQYDLYKSMEKFTQFLNFVSYKYQVDFDKLTKDLKEFSETERDHLFTTSLYDEYKTYVDKHEDDLENKFKEAHTFQTSTRGLKVRGCFPTQQEAELRCKMLREMDPNHDILVGPVGVWMPWDPEAYKTGRTEYLEEELNQLMNEKQKNEKQAKVEFEKRLKESRRKAIEDNIEKAKDSGNVLTQTLNDDGELVNVKNINSTENALLKGNENEIVTSDVIKKTLFNNDNVVMDKDTDHGRSRLTGLATEQSEEDVKPENDTEKRGENNDDEIGEENYVEVD